MNNTKSRFLTGICFAMIFSGLTGCNFDHKADADLKNETTIQESRPVTQSINTDQEIDHPSSTQQITDIKIMDYSQYLKKAWVFEDWNGDAYDNYCSFIITRIEYGFIEGRIVTGELIDIYYNQPDYEDYLGTFTGQISNGIAECQFYDATGNDGNITLKFSTNDKIEVNINYDHKASVYEDQQLNGSYIVRPYNINDIQNFVIDESLSFSEELNSWGQSSEPVEQENPRTEVQTLSVVQAQDLLTERFGENSIISYISDMDRQENGVWEYCFSIDYSNIIGRDTPLIYTWIGTADEAITFQETGYVETGSTHSYTNIPDSMFPVPMVNNMVIPYEWFIPPYHHDDITITYTYDDKSVMDSYREQLKAAGFVDHGTVQSVESLWIYEREEDNATLIIEMYTYDDGFGVTMYVNYLKH